MRVLRIAAVLGSLFATSCGSSISPASPSSVGITSGGSDGSNEVLSIAGSWIGRASDSTGSMMGAGMTPNMMNNMTWNITQTGNAFTGSMQFSGYMGGQMTVAGTITGTAATFTMTMPSGSMMSMMCSAVANGTFDFDRLITQMHGSYSGNNSCSGAFNSGQMSMTRP